MVNLRKHQFYWSVENHKACKNKNKTLISDLLFIDNILTYNAI